LPESFKNPLSARSGKVRFDLGGEFCKWLTYYHHFLQTPPGKHVVRVCCAEACQANGSDALAAHAVLRLQGADVTLEPVYCLGLCSIGPNIQVDETELHAHVTPAKFDALMDALGEDA
jgi:formate dehydrogenase subunit gamma